MAEQFNREAADRALLSLWKNLGDSIAAYVEGGAECMESLEMAKECIQMAELAQVCYRNAVNFSNAIPLDLKDEVNG